MLYRMIEILLSAILLIPFFLVLDKVRFQNAGKTVRYFVFAGYLCAVWLFVGMPTLQFMRFELSLTLLPFVPMIGDLKNTVLNVVLFLPLGILLPFLWKEYDSLKKTVLFGFGMSLSIELFQILTYRATDINDIIANTLGAGVGYVLFCGVSRMIPPVKKYAGGKNEAPVIFLSVFAVMFFLQPYLATLFYKII